VAAPGDRGSSLEPSLITSAAEAALYAFAIDFVAAETISASAAAASSGAPGPSLGEIRRRGPASAVSRDVVVATMSFEIAILAMFTTKFFDFAIFAIPTDSKSLSAFAAYANSCPSPVAVVATAGGAP